MNKWHRANQRGWDAVSPGWQAGVDAKGKWRRCHIDPGLAFRREELEYLGAVSEKDVCVLGSGDNLAVFALAGMGARVTSVDISQVQLDIAAERAGELGLDVSFVRADVTNLSSIGDGRFDLVYTGGHVAVWISDLSKYYSEASRILKPGGLLIVNEYHPFRRIWGPSSERLEIAYPYLDRGPYRYDRSEDVEGAEAGSLPSYEFHWTVGEFVMALLSAGVEILACHEIGDGGLAWEQPSLEGLPEDLLLVGRKRAPVSASGGG